MKRRISHILFFLIIIVGILFLGLYSYLNLPKFGQLPTGDLLNTIKQSPHYINGEFKNYEDTAFSSSRSGAITGIVNYFLTSKDNPAPSAAIPTIKTDLFALDINQNTVIWLGHSSYYIQFEGKRILVDPVLSSNASPIPYTNVAFNGTMVYNADEIPEIDFLLITHDHWDHLDYPTIMDLKDKIAHVICPLGVSAHFVYWGFSKDTLQEADWNTQLELANGLSVYILPAQHYSGRALTRNKTLWAAFALISPTYKIYISGDSGYGSHFRQAGEMFNGFDLAILDSGQYNERWRHIHMMPEDAAKAAIDLQAQAVLPAHIGRFSIAYHAWNDPFIRLAQVSEGQPYRLLTPKIGEAVVLDDRQQQFSFWWEDIN